MMNTLFEEVYWKVCLADFPQHRSALERLLPSGIHSIGGNFLEFERQCEWFLSEYSVPWSRYDRWLAHWQYPDPRIPEIEDGEEVCAASFREAGKLLAHRIVSAYNMEARRRRYVENATYQPYWKLVEAGNCPGCMNDPQTPLHWQSDYWQNKLLPCEWLFCRSRMTAFTEEEAIAATSRACRQP